MAPWHNAPMTQIDPNLGYKAILSRDARFDGRLFVGVSTTGIYCRPVCPATKPKFEHCQFFQSAAAAQDAGFRPCLRCRPETAPNLGAWNGASNTVSRGLALIADGALDEEGATVETLAERLGVGERHLRRLFKEHLGASPISVAQTRRVLFAKQLIHETQLPMTAVAEAAGFGSLRRFNETFQQLYGRPPSAIRRTTSIATDHEGRTTGATLRLTYRPPYDWGSMLAFLSARAIAGVETIKDGVYYRTIRIDGSNGTIAVTQGIDGASLMAHIDFPSLKSLPRIVARIRRVFDLDADISVIASHLSQDPWIAELIAARPGLRPPGAWDSFEMSIRAILGQQVTVEHARRMAGSLTELCGTEISVASSNNSVLGLTRLFPTATEVMEADLSSLGMPHARKRTLLALATAAAADASFFDAGETLDTTIQRLRGIPGIGDWTAHYIALRACRETDAFPASDIGLLRAVTQDNHPRPSPDELLARAEQWRPWRAYAAQHLWAYDAELRKGPNS